jgi:hypothetical protein
MFLITALSKSRNHHLWYIDVDQANTDESFEADGSTPARFLRMPT